MINSTYGGLGEAGDRGSLYKALSYCLHVFAYSCINFIYQSIYLLYPSSIFYRHTHTHVCTHTHSTKLLPRASESCEFTVQRSANYNVINPSVCLEFITKEKSEEGKNAKEDKDFWAHTSQGPAPALEKEIPTRGILTTHKPEK